MVNIGICDDIEDARDKIYDLCEKFFNETKIEHNYKFFSNGKEVLKYCENTDSVKIDLLFLDVEMPGVSGIELKDKVIKLDKIWRIVFVTNHNDSIYSSFSKKTIGFIPKPPSFEKIKKMLHIVLKEKEENVTLLLNGHDGETIEILLDDIVYFKGAGSYTEIAVYSSKSDSLEHILCTKKIGTLEKEMGSYSIIRVHKSYMINLENVITMGEKISFHNLSLSLPVGRLYKEQARMRYLQYGKDKIIKRL